MDTLVYGVITDDNGYAYSGAIVKFSLNKSFSHQGKYYHNNERRALTNKYGIFEISLPPSSLDADGENFYRMTVVYNNVTSENVIVHESEEDVNFADLVRYKFPFERMDFLGDGCHIL